MGKLYIVGFGPGDADSMTDLCRKTLKDADIIVGYTGYTELIRPLFPSSTYYETGMMKESERCSKAIELAQEGKIVCVISSGDSGVYGMASLIFELAEGKDNLEIEVVPGVTAALSGAALLGAPIGNDFAVISLSDLLTPWNIIEKRICSAANGDFCICLYNPGSKKRINNLKNACNILLKSIPPDRLCGITRNIGRDQQSILLLTLSELRDRNVDMTETVFIGNSVTRNINGRMVTPRGYKNV